MPVLTRTFLNDLGIQMDDEQFQSLAEHFETTLHERTINEVVETLTPEQAQELANLQGADDSTIQQWLTATVPDLADIVSDEIDILLGEIAENSENL